MINIIYTYSYYAATFHKRSVDWPVIYCAHTTIQTLTEKQCLQEILVSFDTLFV